VGAKRFSQLLTIYVERQAILSPQLITPHVSSSEFLLALLRLSSDIRDEMMVSNQNQWLSLERETLAVNYCLVLYPVAF
jgi:hypothetical protein